MGGRVALRLLRAGYDLVVWNRTQAKNEQLLAQGAHPAASPADAAGQADAIITMVSDPLALRL